MLLVGPNFRVVLRLRDGVVAEAARPVSYMKGWEVARVLRLAQRWGWSAEINEAEEAQVPQPAPRLTLLAQSGQIRARLCCECVLLCVECRLTADDANSCENSNARVAPELASILKAVWIAPDAVLALAAGLQEFGLQPKAVRKESPILRHDKLWRVSPEHLPNKPFVVSRRLTDKQLEYLRTRRASKKYISTTAPVRGRR